MNPSLTARVAGEAQWLRVGVAVGAVAWGANQFVPLLLVYRDDLGLSAATAQATFGLYAAGLVPGLLPRRTVSDRHGRRPVLVAALVASVFGSGLLLVGGQGVGWLFAGRLVAGIASGAAFSAGAAWLKELSPEGAGARRATVAMTAGFAASPLVAGLLAQWAPDRMVVPYVPHLALATGRDRPRRATPSRIRSPGNDRSSRRGASRPAVPVRRCTPGSLGVRVSRDPPRIPPWPCPESARRSGAGLRRARGDAYRAGRYRSAVARSSS